MDNSRTINSFRNAFVNMAGRLLTILCSFIIRTFFLKYLGDQYTGVSALFTDLLNILSFTELGLGSAISFAFYKPIANKDDKRIAELMQFSRIIYSLISFAILVLGIAIIPFLGFFVKEVPDIKESITVIYLFYLFRTSFSYLLIYKSTLLIAKQKQFLVTITENICIFVRTIVEVVILALTHQFIYYLITEVVFVVISNIIISRLSDKELKNNKFYKSVKVKIADFKELFINVKDILIYKVNGIVLNNTDSLIISSMINTVSVTYLSNYNLLFNAVNNIAYQIISALTASVGNLAVLKDKRNQLDVFNTIYFMCYLFTGISVVGLWLCANPFIELVWSSKYVLDNTIIVLLCLNLFMVNMHMVVDMFRNANGIFHAGRYRPAATAVINLVVSILAAKELGLEGVLLGTVVARLSTQVWYDSKLIFDLVFSEKVIRYYYDYLVYAFLTFIVCALGSFFLSYLNSALARFVLGILIAVILFSIINYCIFHKTRRYQKTKAYLMLVINKISLFNKVDYHVNN